MKRPCVILQILAVSLSLAAIGASDDIPISVVDQQGLSQLIPRGWQVSYVVSVDAPLEWRRQNGSRGIMLRLDNPTVTVRHKDPPFEYKPFYELSLMPENWAGISATDLLFKNGVVTAPPGPLPARQIYPHKYVGKIEGYFAFESIVGNDGWQSPLETVRKAIRKPAP